MLRYCGFVHGQALHVLRDVATQKGRMQNYHYRPFQTSPATVVMLVGLALVVGAIELLRGGSLLPVFPFSSGLHAFFWIMLLVLPLSGFSIGWSYLLTDRHLVVLRFGSERSRTDLSEYVDRWLVAGAPLLKFRSRRVYVISALDDPLRDFLAELDRRIAASGRPIEVEAPELIGIDELRIRACQLQFPSECAVCAQPATSTLPLEFRASWTPWAIIPHGARPMLTIAVPTCERHRVRAKRAKWGARGAALVVVSIALAIVFSLFSKTHPIDCLTLGTMAGLPVVQLTFPGRFDRLVEWWSVGLLAKDVSQDLSIVSLRIRSERLRGTLARTGNGNTGDGAMGPSETRSTSMASYG